jgi:hypothetical protein
MKGLENQTYLVMYIISNLMAVVLLVSAWRWPAIAWMLFFILFAWASWMNWSTALHSPNDFLEYADLTFLPVYKRFFLGWFGHHLTLAVGFIATCQGLIAAAMLLKGSIYKLGIMGGILFLISIAPFGVGSAFPCTLGMAIALATLWHQNAFLWRYNKHNYTIVGTNG